jgi:hypothetical protein
VDRLLRRDGPRRAQDTLPSGDVQVFSVFHARLLEVSELGAWGARRLSDERARKLAEWMSGYTGKFAKSIEEFLGNTKCSDSFGCKTKPWLWSK